MSEKWQLEGYSLKSTLEVATQRKTNSRKDSLCNTQTRLRIQRMDESGRAGDGVGVGGEWGGRVTGGSAELTAVPREGRSEMMGAPSVSRSSA